ncbi:MAG: DUF4445 domain-containing protein, partial [Syntrophomonadaceae bacterium]|nr:DUF4445 domain-containing protein [Syntrophomonadaceae bacterium]
MSRLVKVKIYTASEPLVSWIYEGQTVWQAVQKAGVLQRGDCGGRGICGKCKARVEGDVLPLTSEEEELLSIEEKQNGFRLTCKCHVMGETSVFLPEIRIANLKGGLLMFERYPGVLAAIKKVDTHVPPFNRKSPIPLMERVQWSFKDYELDISSANLNQIAELDQGDGFRITGGVLDKNVLRIYPQGQGRFCGLAVDIGTTWISCALIDLVTGELLGEDGVLNSQIEFGRDILARISYVMENNNGIEELNDRVVRDISLMVEELLEDLDIGSEDILEMTVVGNPVMLHLFVGLDPRGLGRAPYVGLFRRSISRRAAALGMPMHPAGRVLILPQVAGFLGSDVVACLLAVEGNSLDNFLILDIGTNGEMVLVKDDDMFACSIAAGSAFEGGGITSGMVARGGAIDRFWLEDDELKYSVLGIESPQGICGSGLVDLLNVLLDLEVIDETGLIQPDKYAGKWHDTPRGTELIIVEETESSQGLPLVLNQQDIRQLQLAKGAVRAGIDILLKEA